MDEHILIERRGAVLEVRLNRPAKKNALTAEMYRALADALEGADADPGVRVVLFSGAGDAFTAGNDLNDFLDRPPDGGSQTHRFLDLLVTTETPLIAAVHGFAVGIGTTMLLHCDLVYAAPGTRFILPFVSLGLVPEAASTILLPARIGHARASEMLLLSEPVSAEEALASGLISRIFPADTLLDEARRRADRLAAMPAEAVRATKALLRTPDRERIIQQLREEMRIFAERVRSAEARQAMQAFFQSRAGAAQASS